MSIIIALIVFSILVIVHEFGHYIVAKKSGVMVEEFAIGMGPKLFGKQIGETLYSVRLFPIGGFCRMLGEDNDSRDERAFGNKSVSKRMAVVVAGAFMNFLLAFLIVFILTSINGYRVPVVNKLIEGYPAKEAGIQEGDIIKKVNDQKIRIYDELSILINMNKEKALTLTVQRGNELLNYDITPKLSDDSNNSWLLGFESKDIVKGNLIDNAYQSYWTLWMYTKYTVLGFVQLITGQVSAAEMSGPVGITDMMGNAYKSGLKFSIWEAIQRVADLAALISVNLGVVNLLPLPALDGGRFVFLLLEAIRRKPVSAEKEGMVHFIGFVALMILAVFVAYNDVIRLFITK